MARNSIYYLFGTQPVTGGDFVAMDHIVALNALGFDAKAFFLEISESTFRLGIPVAEVGSRIQPNDIVVMGEGDKRLLEPLSGVDCIKILHNQNPYYTFMGFGTIARLNEFGFRQIIAPSDFCTKTLRELGVTVAITRVRPALPNYFKPAPKQLQIAYSPRKRPNESSFVREYFRAQVPEYAHVPWLAITQMPRTEGAAIMAQSPVYAAFPLLESLGLMSLEAMASGCHVVGYTGIGGIEYVTPENGDWVDDGNHHDFVAKLRVALRLHASAAADPKVDAGRETAALFTRAGFENEMKSVWLSIMGENAHRYHKA